jgi:hypothetical protein
MTPLEQEIVELTNIWCRFVGQDHHKDRDCHWYVQQYFSYGDQPYFQAQHWGYIADDFQGSKCTTIEEAHEELRDRLALEIHNSKIWVARNLEDAKKREETGELTMYAADEYQRMLNALNGIFND